jgi:hypothetical protein
MVYSPNQPRKGLKTMFTEEILRQNPGMVKAFMGISVEVFWKIVEVAERVLPEVDRQRLQRADRKRKIGAGRSCDQPIAIRVAAVLTYLRLYAPQIPVALMYGMTQPNLSRDLRRILPAIQLALPCPEVWKVLNTEQELGDTELLKLGDELTKWLLVDATEQRVSRPSENEARKECYSGKKKQFTIKTQIIADEDHIIKVISEGVPGAEHDKTLSDELRTIDRLPDGCKVEADKGYQGLDKQVGKAKMANDVTGEVQEVARLTVQTPYKKPKGGELTEDQKAFNTLLNSIRVRIEHCIGWLKNWAILANRFRCAHSIYTSVFRTISGLVNLQTQRWQAAKTANSA